MTPAEMRREAERWARKGDHDVARCYRVAASWKEHQMPDHLGPQQSELAVPLHDPKPPGQRRRAA